MKTESFQALSNARLTEINGGSFAYDVGRVLRFLYLAGTGNNPAATVHAICDWIAVDVLNEGPDEN
jgi:hypothetical protein